MLAADHADNICQPQHYQQPNGQSLFISSGYIIEEPRIKATSGPPAAEQLRHAVLRLDPL